MRGWAPHLDAHETATVLAMDMNGEKIERAAESIPASLRPKVSFVVTDIAKVELPPGAYDVAILSHSL